MKLVDKSGNGFLTFTEFSKVFSPSMSSNLVTVDHNDSILPNHQPSQEMYKQNTQKIEDYFQKTKEIRDTFKPDQDPGKFPL